MLQLSYTYLRCLWKLERGYLKLKLSWFPKFLSKTVAKLHLVLLCLGKHYSTLREADRSFHCHTMSFLINQRFFFRLVVLIKKFFFISTTKRVRGLLVPLSVPASNLPQSFFHERLAKLRSLEILAGTVARNSFTWKVWKPRGHVFLPIKQRALSLFLMRVLKQSGEWYTIK